MTEERDATDKVTSPERVFESFFGPGSEEERLRIREIASSLGIRDNDAIWIIVFVLNYFGRFYSDLPDQLQRSAESSVEGVKKQISSFADQETNRISSALGRAVLEHAERLAERKVAFSWAVPVCLLLLGVFLLCLLCFVAGAAVAGKGWGISPLDSLLAAPAGWIIPIAMLPLSVYAGYLGVTRFRYNRSYGISHVLISLCLIVLAFFCIGRPF